MKQVLKDLKIQCESLMKLFCDNKSTINIAYNRVQHDRIKHIEIDQHFIKEKLDIILIIRTYVIFGHPLTNMLTNG